MAGGCWPGRRGICGGGREFICDMFGELRAGTAGAGAEFDHPVGPVSWRSSAKGSAEVRAALGGGRAGAEPREMGGGPRELRALLFPSTQS